MTCAHMIRTGAISRDFSIAEFTDAIDTSADNREFNAAPLLLPGR